VQLLELHGVRAEVLGRHGGRSRLGKARSLTSRLRELRHWARGREFDVALAHGSHELTMTARRLGIPSATTFDYEFAWLQHQLGCRAATRVVVPEAIPPDRLERYGVRPPKLRQYPGLKEEYYLADFEPDPEALAQFSHDPARALVVVRTPPDVSLYHRRSNPLFPQVLQHIGRDERVDAIVLPRTTEQRDFVRGVVQGFLGQGGDPRDGPPHGGNRAGHRVQRATGWRDVELDEPGDRCAWRPVARENPGHPRWA